MKQLSEVYYKLNNKIPPVALKFEEGRDELVYVNSQVSLHFTNIRDKVQLTMYYMDKQFEHILKNVQEAYYLIGRFDKEKVKLSYDGEATVTAEGLLWYKLNHKPLWAKIVMTILGSLIMLICGLVALAGILTLINRPVHRDYKDYAILVMLFIFIYAGLSIIMNAFGFRVYEAVHFIAVVMLGFSACMLFCGFVDYFDGAGDGMRDLIGDILLFGFIFIAGFFLLQLSFFKNRKDVLQIRRTVILPPDEQMERLYDRIYEVSKTMALTLRLTEDEPEYTGSRIGGTPYSDGTYSVPTSDDGREMRFLMQINLEEIDTEVSTLPKNGLLQFFVLERRGFEGSVKALYYPFIDSLKRENVGLSKSIRIEPKEMPDVWGVDIHFIRETAADLGIELEDDLYIDDFYNYKSFELPEDDYLLGPIRLVPPKTEIDYGDRSVAAPLLSICADSPLIYTYCKTISNTYFDGFQTFIRKVDLQESDFFGIITSSETVYR